MDTQLIDPAIFEKAPRKRRGSVYDSVIDQILELPKDKGILVPVKGESRAACSRMQTSIRALLKARGKDLKLTFAISADGKKVMISHRKPSKAPKEAKAAKPKQPAKNGKK